ncbi:MAG TPA: NAD(P)H-hydrate dehydratase, partial [Saprospiraceae bacterium]|nr:NAD(P)H-hydrate dehydratase [Saprospiraceae bacterium]
IFGIGLNRPITGYWAKVIELINRQPFQIVAIDIPSGMYANQPTEGTAIKATQTYTFHSPKLNFFFPENEEFVGNWVVLPIPLDEETCRKTPTDYQLIADDILPEIPKRKIFSHKGTYGHALLIGGQYGMAGAALLATRAALRSGCGKVTVLTPSCNQVILQLGAPEALLLPTASERHLSAMTIFTGIYSAIGIGPGLGKHADTVQLMHKLCKANASFVFDADAINILSENPDLLQILPQGSILTPHPKEFERLAGSWNNSIERLQKQIAFSKSHQVYVIFKNAKTTITTPSGKVFFNNTGSPGMAKGGTGDILTGYLTGLLARGLSGLDACLRAVYTHGRAGNLAAADSRSTESMKAGDLLDFL